MDGKADVGDDYSAAERDLLIEAVIDEVSPWFIAGAVMFELGEGPPAVSVQYTPEVGEQLLQRVAARAGEPTVTPPAHGARVIDRAVEIIRRFLIEGLVFPSGGTLTAWGEPWSLTAEKAAEHIEREWHALDRPANIGDIVTLAATEKGARIAVSLFLQAFEDWRGERLARRFPGIKPEV